MAKIETWFTQDLNTAVKPHSFPGEVFNNDSLGNLIGVEVTKDGEPFELTGSVNGYCVLSNGETIPVAGNRSGNKASIVLPQTAYSVRGVIKITLKLTNEDETTTLLQVVGAVNQSVTGNMVNPGSVVQDWSQQIAAALQELQDAEDNFVRVDTDSQGLTETKKNNGRTNIDAASASDLDHLKSALISTVNNLNGEIQTRQTQYGGLNNGLTAEINRATNAENTKVAKPDTNGENGQYLMSNGDGTTTWQNVATPSASDIANAISAWLDDHPDATTTVIDDSITIQKLSATNKLAVKRALSANSILFPEKVGSYFSGMTRDIEGKTIRNMQACTFLSPDVAVVAYDAYAETTTDDPDRYKYRRLQRVSMLNGAVLDEAYTDIGHGNSLAFDGNNTVAVVCYSALNENSEYVIKTFNATTLASVSTVDLSALVSSYITDHIYSIAYHQATNTWIIMGGGYLHDGGRVCVELNYEMNSVVQTYTLIADVGKIEAAQDMTCDNDYIYVMCGRYDTVAVFDMASKAFVGAFKTVNYYNDDMYIGETESLTAINGILYTNARIRPNNVGGQVFGIINSFGKMNLFGSFGSNADWNATKKSRAIETKTVWVNSSATDGEHDYTDINFFTATGAYSKPFATIYEALCLRHDNTLQINLLSDITMPVYIVNDDVYIAGRKNNYIHADEDDEDEGGDDRDESSDLDPSALVTAYIKIAGLYAKDSNIRVSGCIINGTVTKGEQTAYLFIEHSNVNLGGIPDIVPLSGDTTNGIIVNAASVLRWTRLTSVPKTIQPTCAYYANGIDVLSVQTGVATTGSDGTITVTFSVNMRSTPAIALNGTGTNTAQVVAVRTSSVNNTGFKALATRIKDSNGVLSLEPVPSNAIRWIAIAI